MKKVKIGLAFIGAVFVIITSSVAPSPAEVNVNVGIGIPLPPPLVIPVPPPMIPIPRTYVYFPPTIDVILFFSAGTGIGRTKHHWFRARSYNGPLDLVEPHRIPRAVISLPPGLPAYTTGVPAYSLRTVQKIPGSMGEGKILG